MGWIEPYRPDAPDRYAAEAATLRKAFGSSALAFEHVGSSAVPGLDGKPTIDVAVAVRDLDLPASVLLALHELGLEDRGTMGVPGRRYFRKGTTYPRDVNVHVVRTNSSLWNDMLRFRDVLRGDPELARAYGEAKRDAVEAIMADPAGPSYGERKAAFIEGVFARQR